MRAALLVTALCAATGCFHESAVECSDGRICPPGETCDVVDHLCIPAGCGDHQIAGSEQCDSEAPPGVDCTSFGYYARDGLACDPQCRLDTSACGGGRCGDEVVNGTEICDGIPPTAQTCLDYGFDLGRLECPACTPEFPSCGMIGWHTMPGAASAELHAIWGSSATDLYAVGFAGTILHSQGTAWTPIASGTTADLLGIWGSSASDIYAVGAGVIVHYDGNTWTPQMIAPTLNAIWGSARDHVIAVGAAGTIMTFDGTAWTTTTAPTVSDLNGVWGSSASDVYAVGTNGTIAHYDGAAWTTTTLSSGMDLHAVWGSDASNVYAAGGSSISSGALVQSHGGGPWTVGSNLGKQLWAVQGTSPGSILVAGNTGALWHYDGTTLLQQDPATLRTIFGLWGAAPDHVFAVTRGGTIQEYVGTATQTDAVTANVLRDVTAFASGDAVATGEGGTYARFVAGAWQPAVTNSTLGVFRSVWGTSADDFFVVSIDTTPRTQNGLYHYAGTLGPVIHTTAQFDEFEGVWGTSNTDIYAVGVKGRIAHYDGVTFTEERAANTGPDLDGVWGSSSSDIYAVGDSGAILHRDNGTWSPQPSPTTLRLNSIWGSGPSDIYAVGDSGAIVHRDASGWRKMSSGTGENLLAVRGTGPSDVFAAGSSGTVLHYDGVAWSPIRLPVGAGVVYGASAGTSASWFVTDAGTAVRLDRIATATEARCGDGWDDDHDGLVDCADDDCASDPRCQGGGACAHLDDVTCGQALSGSTYTGLARIDDVPCLPSSHRGPEASYRFLAATTGPVTVTLADTTLDLELAVLGSYPDGACDPRSCVGTTSGTSATFTATAGETYHILVDGPNELAGHFTLTIGCSQ